MWIILLTLISFFSYAVNAATLCKGKTSSNTCVQVSILHKNGDVASDVVVYLLPLAGQKLPKTSDIVTISQRNQAFSPYITVSQINNEVNFANKDDITHHIYSAGSDDKFAFKIKAGEEHLSEPFKHETEVAMGCNIHDWMSGTLLVVDTPYFGKTDSKGNIDFVLSELGKYQIIVWHPQLPVDTHRVSQDHNILGDSTFKMVLPRALTPIPEQKNDNDFDFVSGY